MKKVILITILLNAVIQSCTKAQTDTVIIANKAIPVEALKIYTNQISFVSLKNNLPTQFPVNEVSAIVFKNAVRINFRHHATINSSPAYYNATINLTNGSFFTAFVDSIDQSFLYYHKYGDDAAVKTDLNDIIYLVYTNGTKADFITSNSIKAIATERNKPKAVENRSNTGSFLGAMLGLSNAWINADIGYNLERSANNGIAAGIILNKEFAKTSGIHMGLLYEQNGVIYSSDSTKAKLETAYLSLPFTYQVFAGNQKFKGFFEGGFYFAYLLSGKQSFMTPDTLINWSLLSTDFNVNRFDLGFLFGTGIKYKLHSHQFTGGIRYAFGLYTLNSNPLQYYPYYVSYGSPNRSFVFYISYGIDLINSKQQRRHP